MKTTADFLDDLRAHFALPSDGKLAVRMGWAPQQLSRYRTKKEVFGDQTAMRIASELGTDPGYVIACMKAQLAKTPELRKVWERMAAKIAACFVFGIALTGAPSPAAAGSLHNQNGRTTGPEYTYATKRRRGALRRAVAALSAWCRALALAAIALAAILAPAHAAEAWTVEDTAREAFFQTLLTVDCAQTRYGASHPRQFEERNPILGKHPSKGRINTICLGVGAGHYFISRWLSRETRTFWQHSTIFIEVYAVGGNYMAGVGMEF